ncbi:hypothetical protein AYM40_20960 [Paraburkholderia phytofirmans OLGA172]|uniref:PIN domain-containing protein n=1 Tax=Paraburkholderia phytofirmans OLGA172 TaxID=1417228 RepID=A0A167W8Q7_9BURK|nr:hypothetical protein [Paraburkholderia phytofirmans]ANB74923.1 hypothetical protein AYM40_20960 [Paraburkholderia phytofirmans OLGA172]
MRVLIDNDALLKLARYDLLAPTLEVLGVQPHAVEVLVAAPYVLLPGKERLKRCKDEDSARRIEAFLGGVGRIDAQTADADLLDTLTGQPNIDAGEALLLASAATHVDTLIVTGDKRALAALCTDDSLAIVRDALDGRVVTLEILFAMLSSNGLKAVQDKVRLKPDVDKALTYAFGVSAPADPQSVFEALRSYIGSLREATGQLLYALPP